MLTAGTRLGPYEVTAQIGEGGMGQVYRARDTKLDRDVAIKILPEAFAHDADLLARFTREAKTLASLNHPNIAAIYGLEESPSTGSGQTGVTALVMELVEGEDLSQRIEGLRAKGSLLRAAGASAGQAGLPIDEALPIAKQIADALEAAHEQGIIHRDLKPANIKVRSDGTVKVLDFGLAKLDERSASLSGERGGLSMSPTLSMHATMQGVILGTAAYMAPEQARGKTVDKRADIWAFGVVLFEMLTGTQPFPGEDISHVLARVIDRDPDWSALPPALPPALGTYLRRCLVKDPRQRIRDIGDVRLALEGAFETAVPNPTNPESPIPNPVSSWRHTLPWAVATVAIIGAAVATLRPAPSAIVSSLELAIGPPEGRDFQIGSNSGNVTISPDGTMVAFVAPDTDGSGTSGLWVRPTARDEPRLLSGTKGATYPFWAPDSRSLAFFAERKLRSVEIAGGLPQVVADVEQGRGGCWGDDGRMLFTPVGGGTVFSVAAAGGAVTPVTKLNAARGENANYWATCLPGSRHFLYFARSTQPENNGVYFASVDGKGEPVKVVSSMSSALYVAPSGGRPGYMLWARDQDLLAQPFDAEFGRTSGQAVKIASGVMVEESQRGLMAGASRTGMLAWATARAELIRFAWLDRGGRRLSTLPIDAGHQYQPQFSPDGRLLVFYRVEKGSADIMIHDLAGGATRRVTSDPGYNQQPAWLPDGRGLLYVNESGLKRLMLDGSAPPVTITNKIPVSDTTIVTPDGRFAVAPISIATPGVSVWAFAMAPPFTATQLFAGPGNQFVAQLSPDGRWLLWGIVDGARRETHLVRLMTDGDKPHLGAQRIPVTLGGGEPIGWRRDGREIFYFDKNRAVTAMPVTLQAESAILGPPTTLFTLPQDSDQVNAPAVTADGSRFLVSETPFAQGQTIRILTNWTARLSGEGR